MNEMVAERDFVVSIPQGDALAVFTTDGAIDPILGRIRKEVDEFVATSPDVATAAGRDAIKSFAFKVTKSKTALEEVGKDLAAEQKKIPALIDATRRRIKETLDAWRDEVRQPVTDWEAAEEARIDRIKVTIREFEFVANDHQERSSEVIRERLAEVKAEVVSEDRFAEYTGAAVELKDKAIAALEAKLAATEKRETEAAELARLRAESEARAKADRDEAIRKEAAEGAERRAKADADAERQRAEASAKAEREAADKREAELKQAAADAERRAADAEERVRREAQEKADREDAAQRAREADQRHRATVNRAALQALVDAGIAEEIGKTVIKLIINKSVPAVSISY